MAAKTNSWIDRMLLLMFKNTAAANIGDAAGLQPSAAAGNLYISLHDVDPGLTGTQSTYEIGYTNYARIPVARSAAGWTVVSQSVRNAAVITFPTCGATSAWARWVGIGTAPSGSGVLLYAGQLDTALLIVAGTTPSFPPGNLVLTEI